ncbi:hypothetical protein B0H12DRAFT_1120893 [Mycena haematopus]|nr:hypothetical protein B0H12DRAFT_1120893 [Mycena haematopus]
MRYSPKQSRSHPQIPSHKCRSHEPEVWPEEFEVAGWVVLEASGLEANHRNFGDCGSTN